MSIDESVMDGQQDPGVPATPEDNQPSPAAGSGNEGAQNASTPSPAPSGNEGDDYRDYRREAGKYRKEYEKFKNNYESVSKRYTAVEGWIKRDPELYLKALVETNEGVTEEEALAEVRRTHPSFRQSSSQSYTSQAQPTAQPDFVADPYTKQALDRLRESEYKRSLETQSAIKEFLDDESNADIIDNFAAQQSISATARFLMDQDSSLSVKDALQAAKTRIYNPDQYREAGIVEGMGRALSSVGATSSGASAGARGRSTPSVTHLDEEVMRTLGITTKEQRDAYIAKLQDE